MDEIHLNTNRARWDELAELHRESYDTSRRIDEPDIISSIVVADAAQLAPFLPDGAVVGLDLLHLQCHIGTDTLSWARLGARVTGLDLSPESLRVARELAQQAGLDIEYVQSSIADGATALVGRRFDVVYTSIGVLAWLDDLTVWANLIASVLRPGGIFFIREGHPMAMCFDPDAPPGEFKVKWPYFDTGPQEEENEADYSSPEPVHHTKTYEWSHSLAEIIQSLLRAGLTILDFNEHQDLPWQNLPWMELDESLDSYVLPGPMRDYCPLAFSIVARR